MKARKVYETGGSVVVSLPRDVREDVGIDVGADVGVEADGDQITVAPLEIERAHRAGGGDE